MGDASPSPASASSGRSPSLRVSASTASVSCQRAPGTIVGLRRPRERRLRALNPGRHGPACEPPLPPEVDDFDLASNREARGLAFLIPGPDESDEESADAKFHRPARRRPGRICAGGVSGAYTPPSYFTPFLLYSNAPILRQFMGKFAVKFRPSRGAIIF